MNEKLIHAIKLREEGKTFNEIGNLLNVGERRASQIYHDAIRMKEKEALLPEWTKGLNLNIANALLSSGYRSKQEVISGIKSKKIGLVRGSSQGLILGVGRSAIRDISIWSGLSTPQQEARMEAITLLESEGYIIKRPSK
jgi:hypothetical protein